MTKTAIDFSKGKRGPIVKRPGTKQRITIRIDQDLLDWFRQAVGASGGSYQTLMNKALREYVARADGELAVPKPKEIETILRRVIREEVSAAGPAGRRVASRTGKAAKARKAKAASKIAPRPRKKAMRKK